MPLTIEQVKILLADAVIAERERTLEVVELKQTIAELLNNQQQQPDKKSEPVPPTHEH